jgi:hypothetical protein
MRVGSLCVLFFRCPEFAQRAAPGSVVHMNRVGAIMQYWNLHGGHPDHVGHCEE